MTGRALAVIVPVLNEAANLPSLARNLEAAVLRETEILLVDGGSQDDTVAVAEGHGLPIIVSAPGRARQMNAGAAATRAPVLLFLHADTHLPMGADTRVRDALKGQSGWGRFNVRIRGRSRVLLPLVAALMNQRSRLTGIATGDQALFMRRELFDSVGGFPDQPLMEDIEISRRLRRITAPRCLRARVSTSGRRWEQHGAWRTILLMWHLRWLYWRGTSAHILAQRYNGQG
ncbi:glycosyl transferase [Ectothiorhodospira haloalkaliphila]|uniref:Glycosyl transferase n=1 Tax=Ectothiorhodospira haloalkaliphila TaxID=421628 RepID=W8KLU5_9GAMM|nr:TIGR04283 family arsenosugar biosynthesis glycosyltransferase [Ectothiorhodospira haloalkaliphila]MCG5494219.1 TIGR04283 family arsenosugar biosynthesis glycosyltransferase [Ectothiorhodospira variabilis]AHK77957.1 glycosyl transferase [Ectothiorhodospira haloalkaliphila]MCG5496384.1 TIGR04283 family arsenosugar biosynthesis glycosyltransferase [Ectothiorhodospira variabilis]MCG5504835.1 TIGR04283 family arsenosugar biosynthesis glycosyltransferase [Ectothiorhodospira variabilis]MCG5507992.